MSEFDDIREDMLMGVVCTAAEDLVREMRKCVSASSNKHSAYIRLEEASDMLLQHRKKMASGT